MATLGRVLLRQQQLLMLLGVLTVNRRMGSEKHDDKTEEEGKCDVCCATCKLVVGKVLNIH